MRSIKIVIAATAVLFGTLSVADEGTVRVLMTTSQGEISIDRYLDEAPLTAGNFLQLVENGDMDGGSFYRVITYENQRAELLKPNDKTT